MLERGALRQTYAIADRDRSRVRTNFVQSIDGAVTLHGRSGTLGGAGDREVMGVLREMADVVLVGAGTTRVEGYGGLSLDEEHTRWRDEQGLPPVPRLAVVSRRLDLEVDASLFADSEHPPLIVTCAASPEERRDALSAVAEVMICGEETVDLTMMLRMFTMRGWPQVLCEGGPHLIGALLDADLVDEVCVTISPRLVGGEAGRMVSGAAETAREFSLAGAFADGEGFIFLHYAR